MSSRFSLSRCSSSCHLVAPVVIASLCLLRRPVLVVPCSHCSRLPCPMCFVPAPPASVLVSCVLVWFLIVLLPVLAISRAGRSLLAHFLFVAALALSSRVPVLACPSWIVFDRSLRSPFSSHAAACPPRLSTSVGGECVGSFLLACHRPPSCVRRLVSAGWCRRGWFVARRGCVSACCVWFVVSVFVYINWVLARV